MNRKDQLLFLMDSLIDQALDLEFDLQQVNSFFDLKIIERSTLVQNIAVLFLDCHREHLSKYIRGLSEKLRVSIEFEVLETFHKKATPEYIRSYDLVVTTCTHYDEVAAKTRNLTALIGIDTIPNLKSIVRISKLPMDKPIGVAGTSPRYFETLERALTRAGTEGLQLTFFLYGESSPAADEFLQTHEYLVVSPDSENPVRKRLTELGLERDIIPSKGGRG